jgi:ABC-2 type transport system permease protein
LATLSLQWQFLPWVSVIFLPALAMRSFQGKNLGDISLILSYPIPAYSTIIGKWLAGIMLIVCALVLTFPFLITVSSIGTPDLGIVVSGYLGAFLALSFLYAVALLASAICKEEVSSFLLGSGLIFILLFTDVNALQTSLVPEWFKHTSHYLFVMSPKHWMDELTTGQISLSAVMYFILLTSLTLSLACQQMRGYYSAPQHPFAPFISGIFGVLLSAALVGSAARAFENFDLKIDVTEHKEYTFRQGTLEIAKNSPHNTQITLYVSEDKSLIPPQIVQHIDRVSRALANLTKQSDSRIDSKIVFLKPDTDFAETAELKGVRKMPMSSGDSLYFGAVFTSGSKQLVISYFDVNRATSLEYDLALQLSNLSRSKTPHIGVLSSVLKPAHTDTPHPGLSVLEELKSQYDVSIIPYFSNGLKETYDVLVIFDAPVIRKETLKDIDLHIQSGKGAILMLDPFQRMNSANAALSIKPSKDGQINSIDDLLRFYGLHFSNSKIVGDFKSAATVESTTGRNFSYPYWLQIKGNNISKKHTVSEKLKELLFAEAGFFETNKKEIDIQPIILTSDETNFLSKQELREKSTETLATEFKTTSEIRNVIALHLSGQVVSPYEQANNEINPPTTSIFAIADVDWIYNGFSLADARMGDRVFSRPINDNHKLFLNMVEHIAGDPNLTGIRSRESPIRTFVAIERMLLESRKAYHKREADYSSRISNTETSIAKVLELTGAKSVEELPLTLRGQIKNLRSAAYPIRRELREIRLKMREGINNKFKNITLINLLSGPVLSLALFLFIRRFRQTGD